MHDTLFKELPAMPAPSLVERAAAMLRKDRRPERHDPLVLADAVERFAPGFVRRFGDPTLTLEQASTDLVAVLEREDEDGFAMGKALERRGYAVDAGLVEDLEALAAELHAAVRRAERAWVRQHRITVPFAPGQSVRVLNAAPDIRGRTGIVVGIDAERATCTVRIPELGHVEAGQVGTHGFVLAVERLEPAG